MPISTIQPAPTIRDLGVILDTELSFSPHINLLVCRCFYQLRIIKRCVRSLPADATKSVVNSFFISRIDYCNCLLAGCHKYQLDRLQTVTNTAARLILGLRKYDSIPGALRDRLSFKVTNFDTNRKPIYDFLLVINSNLPPILHRFRDITVDRSRIAILGYPSCV